MTDPTACPSDAPSAEDELRAQLERGDAVARSIVPILRHLLAAEDSGLFSDEIVARVRGMVSDIAGQLIGEPDDEKSPDESLSVLTDMLADNAALLTHLHALALEWQLTERLHARLSLDAVLSPLMQALVASAEPATSALAMQVLAAQARFCQTQRRMQLQLAELPGDLLHAVLVSARTFAGIEPEADARAAEREASIRQGYDEGSTRLAMLSRLVADLGTGATAALSIEHAGAGLFLSALAAGSGLDRDAAVLATHETQRARLALALRRAGLKAPGVNEQLLAFHSDLGVPESVMRIGAEDAAVLLGESGSGWRT
ncbi:MAG TPA: hypothetical protein VJM34_09840 [Novosphingobium sp.]|nr:hypothetical protein [Novosphingobium sp.]